MEKEESDDPEEEDMIGAQEERKCGGCRVREFLG